jgi:glutamate-1-semialdehyde 2,1-aminomutase
MAAAIAALDELERDDGAVYRDLERRGMRLMQGLAALAGKHRLAMRVQGLPAIFQVFFTTGPAPRNYREADACDRDRALRLPPRAAGGGDPHQPCRQVVPVGGARRCDHRPDA